MVSTTHYYYLECWPISCFGDTRSLLMDPLSQDYGTMLRLLAIAGYSDCLKLQLVSCMFHLVCETYK